MMESRSSRILCYSHRNLVWFVHLNNFDIDFALLWSLTDRNAFIGLSILRYLRCIAGFDELSDVEG